MYYNEATGCNVNNRFEKILGTEFRFDVPYAIDKEKYVETLKTVGEGCRIPDATVVSFAMHHNSDDDGDTKRDGYTLFVSPCNSPEGSKDFYDCIQFNYYRYEGRQKDEFELFTRQILACITGPSVQHIMNLGAEIRANINKEFTSLSMLDDIIYSNSKK